jgi:hypothetical protein
LRCTASHSVETSHGLAGDMECWSSELEMANSE